MLKLAGYALATLTLQFAPSHLLACPEMSCSRCTFQTCGCMAFFACKSEGIKFKSEQLEPVTTLGLNFPLPIPGSVCVGDVCINKGGSQGSGGGLNPGNLLPLPGHGPWLPNVFDGTSAGSVSPAPLPRLVVTTFEKAIEDVCKTIAKAFDDTARTVAQAGTDTIATVTKAGADTVAETKRFGREFGTAASALVEYYKSLPTGGLDAVRSAEQRIREGKVMDAVWHAALAPIQVEEKSASEAVLESDYLRAIGQIAASSYGGPSGAAAYAAWLAYHQSDGNASIALRVGILAGATAFAFSTSNEIDSITKKAIVTGAIGGLAVAAAGGDQKAIEEAFLKAGAMIIVQDGYREFTKHPFDPTSAQGEPYCITAAQLECTPLPDGAKIGIDENGNFIVDMTKIDPKIPAVGKKDYTAYFNESNPIMNSISRVPGMQAMAVFHDQWAFKWNMGALATPATIMPAIALTYIGTSAPYFDQLEKTAVEEALHKHVSSNTSTPERAQPFEEKVSDSYVQISSAMIPRTIILEQKNDEDAKFCSNGILLEKKIKGKTISNGKWINTEPLSMTQCMKGLKFVHFVEQVNLIYPSQFDYACRILKTDPKGDWHVVVSSLFGRNGCNAALVKLRDELASQGRVYRGDARSDH